MEHKRYPSPARKGSERGVYRMNCVFANVHSAFGILQHLPNARRISFSTGVACTALSRAHICGSSSVIDSIALFIALCIAFRKWSTSFSHFSLKSFSLGTKKNELGFWFHHWISGLRPSGIFSFEIDFMERQPTSGIALV